MLYILLITITLIVALIACSSSLNPMKANVVLILAQFSSYASMQGHVISVNKDLGASGTFAGNNGNSSSSNNSSAYLIGKTMVHNLSRLGILPPGSPAHLIPFHPKNTSAYSAAKKQASLGISNSNIKVFSTRPTK